jgi:hypothetical protein
MVPFSFHPDFAVGEVLFFPNGYQALEPVDPFQSGFEGGLAVRRGYNYHDAGFADQQAAEPMHQRDPVNGVAAAISRPMRAII